MEERGARSRIGRNRNARGFAVARVVNWNEVEEGAEVEPRGFGLSIDISNNDVRRALGEGVGVDGARARRGRRGATKKARRIIIDESRPNPIR